MTSPTVILSRPRKLFLPHYYFGGFQKILKTFKIAHQLRSLTALYYIEIWVWTFLYRSSEVKTLWVKSGETQHSRGPRAGVSSGRPGRSRGGTEPRWRPVYPERGRRGSGSTSHKYGFRLFFSPKQNATAADSTDEFLPVRCKRCWLVTVHLWFMSASL